MNATERPNRVAEALCRCRHKKHSVRGFISTLGSKHGYNVVSTRRETDKARCYSIEN
jgi:hypothetical protein